MKSRSIHKIIPAQRVPMGDIYIDQPLPAHGVDQIDPFLLVHHGKLTPPGGKTPQESGVPPHPHRGFSPVTFIFKGDVHHRDSLGNSEIVTEGGTQWINAGRGIMHSERPSKKLAEKGGENEIIQFWVNSPAKHKMDAPYYLPLSKEETPTIELPNAIIQVVAGSFNNIEGPAKTLSPQTLLRIDAEKGAQLKIPLPSEFNTLIYVLHGSVQSDDQTAKDKELIWFSNDGDELSLNIKDDSRFIVLSGEPINEPISTYGPFVMNTPTEITQALRDAQSGKMGILHEEFDE